MAGPLEKQRLLQALDEYVRAYIDAELNVRGIQPRNGGYKADDAETIDVKRKVLDLRLDELLGD